MCYSFIRDCRPREVEVRGEEKEGTQGGRIPWRRKWYPAPVVLPGKHHGQRSRKESDSLWSHKESDTAEHLHVHTANRSK